MTLRTHYSFGGLMGLLGLLFLGVVNPSYADSVPTRADLENQLRAIQTQIDDYENQLAATKGQSKTLAAKIVQLKKQQTTLNLEVKAANLALESVNHQIGATQTSIKKNELHEKQLRDELTSIIRLIHERDAQPFLVKLINVRTISGVMEEIEQYFQLSNGLTNTLAQIKDVHTELRTQLITLDDQHDASQRLLSLKELAQQQLSRSVSTQNALLKETRGRESAYQTLLVANQKEVAAIKSRIYQLFDATTQINFGQALVIAKWVGSQTGIDPAFLLAILTQESNLGKNVGTCNRAGDPPEKSWRVIMKPTRDQVPFQAITKELGRDPDTTPVSCPMRDRATGKQMGWGGAMGPAQFIPSTWVGYASKVSALTGKTPANPWDIRDAFVAAGIKLRAGGADGTRKGNWNAAMRYFSGSTNPQYRFYGDNVLSIADGYQQDIDKLTAGN